MNASPVGPLRLMQLAARALDDSDNVVIMLEPSGAQSELRIVGVNGAFCRVFATTADEATGRTLASFANEGNNSALAAAIADAVASHRSLRAEMRCRTGAGVKFWFGLHLMASTDPATGEQHFILLGRDISERKSAGAKQDVIQHLLTRVFVSVDAAVMITSPDGQILMNNPQLEQLFGYPSGNLVGRHVTDLIAPRAYDAAMEQRRQSLPAGEDYRVDSVGRRPDGSEVPIHISSVVAQVKGSERFRIVTVHARPPPAATSYQLAGMIKLIGLDDVKTALGPRWPEVEQRAMQTAEHLIDQSLGPGETFTRSMDGSFVICFAGRSEEECSFTAAMIGRRIRERLIGQDEELAGIQVTAITGAVELPATEKGENPIDLPGLLERRLSSRRLEIEAKARRMLTEVMAETRGTLAPVEAGDRPRLVAYLATIPKPAWRTMITAHGGLPATEQAGFDLDAVVLGLAAERVQQGLLTDLATMVFVDVDFQVFQRRAATQRYLETCRRLTPTLRQRLILTLGHLPAGIPSTRLEQCVQLLRPFCRSIAFTIDEPRIEPSDPRLDRTPLIAIGAAQISGPGSADRLSDLLKTVHAKRGRLLGRDVPDAPTAALLRRAGVDLIALAEV